MHLFGPLEPLDSAIRRVVTGFEVVFVITYVVTYVGRGSASPAVIVNHQISGEPHQPVGQITGLRVILVQGAVDAHEYFLRQILDRFVTSGEPVCEVEDAA